MTRFPDAIICQTTGKRGYDSRKAARQARKRHAVKHAEAISSINVYRCEHCERFHIGHTVRHHLPADIITRLHQVRYLATRVNEQQRTLCGDPHVYALRDGCVPAAATAPAPTESP